MTKKKQKKSLRLELATHRTTDPKTGLTLEHETISKGLLNRTTTSIVDAPSDGWHKLDSRGSDDIAVEWMHDTKKGAQAILAKANLPTDHPLNLCGLLILQNKIASLSPEESAAKLIDSINAVLEFGNKEFVFAALQFAASLHASIMNDGLNDLAVSGHAADLARAAAGDRKIENYIKARDVIREVCLDRFSVEVMKAQGAKETVRAIIDEVNCKLHPPLKTEAIAEHIRDLFGLRRKKSVS